MRSTNRHCFLSFVPFLIILCFAVANSAASDVPEAGLLFGKRCTACHTYGKGIRVGPDLKGVTDRHPRSWLLSFIRSSQSVIQGGDPKAVALFREFKQQRMPDWTDLTPKQIEGLIDYFAAGGPEQRTPDERNAEIAGPLEIEVGRKLFHGESRFTYGGEPCSSCHQVRSAVARPGGTLGPDLTLTYLKYQDKALTAFLKTPCVPRDPELTGAKFLTPEESFFLKTYLRQLSLSQIHPAGSVTSFRSDARVGPGVR